MNTKHTPTPWVVGGKAKLGAPLAPGETPRIWANDGASIADISIRRKIGDGTSQQELVNADYIVRACNAHDELVAALKLLETAARRYAQGLDGSSAYVFKMADNARAALATTDTWESLGRGIVEIEPDQSGT